MKKIYLLAAVTMFGFASMAQTKEKAKKAVAKSPKTAVAVKAPQADVFAAPAQPTTTTEVKVAPAPAMAAGHNEHDGHNHGAVAPAVDMAKPLGEDNLTLVETNFDFGKIPQGKPVYHDYVIKNTGKTELRLDNVQAGCGCTTPNWQPGPYKAGETAKINVGFNAGAVGPFTKSVTITYNGGLTKVITFNGEVLAAPATPAPENKAVEVLKKGGK